MTNIAFSGELRQYLMPKITFPCSGERPYRIASNSAWWACRIANSRCQASEDFLLLLELLFVFTQAGEPVIMPEPKLSIDTLSIFAIPAPLRAAASLTLFRFIDAAAAGNDDDDDDETVPKCWSRCMLPLSLSVGDVTRQRLVGFRRLWLLLMVEETLACPPTATTFDFVETTGPLRGVFSQAGEFILGVAAVVALLV